jgi:hypothetical protein
VTKNATDSVKKSKKNAEPKDKGQKTTDQINKMIEKRDDDDNRPRPPRDRVRRGNKLQRSGRPAVGGGVGPDGWTAMSRWTVGRKITGKQQE